MCENKGNIRGQQEREVEKKGVRENKHRKENVKKEEWTENGRGGENGGKYLPASL